MPVGTAERMDGMTATMAPKAAQRSILIVANPTSGGFRRRRLDRIAKALQERGHRIAVRLTERAGELTEICADPDLSADIVAVMGGDGSLNEAIAGLWQSGNRSVTLALIPAGTANVLALDLGLPRRTRALVDMLDRGRAEDLNFGLANGKPFVLMVSVGVDAEIVHAVSLPLKRRFGKLAYAIATLRVLFRGSRHRVVVDTGAAQYRFGLAVITSASKYGGDFTLCPDASPRKPGLNLVGLPEDGWAARFRFGRGLATGRLCEMEGVISEPVEAARITAEPAAPCQVDGDPFGVTPIEVASPDRPVSFVMP